MTAVAATPNASAPARRRALILLRWPFLVALLVATAVTVVAWTTGDWWAINREFGGERNLTIARILLFAGVFGATLGVRELWRRSSRLARLAFAGWTGYLGFWLFGQWPGLVEPDTIDMFRNAQEGIVYEWFSYLSALIHLAVLDVVPHVGIFGVLQVLGMAALLAYVTALIAERSESRVPPAIFVALGVLSSPLVVYTIHFSRDTWFAMLHVVLALLVARAVAERRGLSRGGLVAIAALAGFLSAYRGDGPVVLITVAAVLLALRPPRRTLIAGAAVFAASVALFHVVLPAAVLVKPVNPHYYELTLQLNPLGAVLQSDFASENRERDLAGLRRVLDPDKVREIQTPVNIPAFWTAGIWRWDASEADWQAYGDATDRLFKENAPTVLANRLTNFAASSGLQAGAYRGPEYIYVDWADRVTSMQEMNPVLLDSLTAEPPVQRLYMAQEKVIHATSDFKGVRPAGAALHWNLLPWLGVLLAAMLAFRRARFEAIVAVIILSRVPLVFLVAPIAQFKYYNSVHLGGLVVVGLLLTRVRKEHLARLIPALRPEAPAYEAAANASTSAGVPSGTTSRVPSLSR